VTLHFFITHRNAVAYRAAAEVQVKELVDWALLNLYVAWDLRNGRKLTWLIPIDFHTLMAVMALKWP
jgi:hypothetical protein